MTDDDQSTATGDERHEETESTATGQARDDVGEGAEGSGADEGKPDEASTDAGPADEDEDEQIKQEMKQIEEDPPENLEDWPQGKAKYETMGGPEGEHGYHEGPEQNLGPSSLRHHEGGDVSIAGEKVDNPEEYKGEPVPGGPTDPNSPDAGGERDKEKAGEEGGES